MPNLPHATMNYHFVYALYSEKHHKIYIGYSSNIKARLKSHYHHSNKGFTFRFRPWKLIYLERIENRSKGLIREKQLKSAKGRDFIWSLIRDI